MSRNKEYDEQITKFKSTFENFDFETYGLYREEVIFKISTLLDDMQAVYEAKDSDYSENDLPMGNLLESQELGIAPWKGVLLRIGDKKRRIGSFVKKQEFLVKDEAVNDTLVDMANYSMLGFVLWSQKFNFSNENSEIVNSWEWLALNCILTKVLFDHKNIVGVSDWAEIGWPEILRHYNVLAEFARNN
jgi:hypothetical protein